MMSKILIISILVAVRIISSRTAFTINTCQTDQAVLDHVGKLSKGIFPILVIQDINSYPLDSVNTLKIQTFCEGKKISNLFVVTANTCVKTFKILNEYADNKEYPSIFMLKDGQLVPKNIIYISSDSITTSYNIAFKNPMAVSKIRFAWELRKEIGDSGSNALRPKNQSNKTSTGEGLIFYTHQISSGITLTIRTCRTDRDVLNYVERFQSGIVPILCLANIDDNPLKDETTKDLIKKYYEDRMVSNLLVVTADTCIATDISLHDYGANREYPSLFALKEDTIVPGNIKYTSLECIAKSYNNALNHQIVLPKVSFSRLLGLFVYSDIDLNEVKRKSLLKKIRTEESQSSRAPQVFNTAHLGSTDPTPESFSYQTAPTNQSIIQHRSKLPIVRPPSHGTLASASNPASTRSTDLAPTSTYSTGRQGDDYQWTGSMTSPSSQWQQPEVRYPVSGGTQFTAAGTSVIEPVETYPIGKELQTQDFLSTMGRRRDHEGGIHLTPLQSSGLELFAFEKRKRSESSSGSQ